MYVSRITFQLTPPRAMSCSEAVDIIAKIQRFSTEDAIAYCEEVQEQCRNRKPTYEGIAQALMQLIKSKPTVRQKAVVALADKMPNPKRTRSAQLKAERRRNGKVQRNDAKKKAAPPKQGSAKARAAAVLGCSRSEAKKYLLKVQANAAAKLPSFEAIAKALASHSESGRGYTDRDVAVSALRLEGKPTELRSAASAAEFFRLLQGEGGQKTRGSGANGKRRLKRVVKGSSSSSTRKKRRTRSKGGETLSYPGLDKWDRESYKQRSRGGKWRGTRVF